MKRNSYIVNFFGSPGSGKTFLSNEIFHILKQQGYNCGYINEYATECISRREHSRLEYQPILMANQIYYQQLWEKYYDVIVTEAPLIIGAVYRRGVDRESFRLLMEHYLYEFKLRNNINIFLLRDKTAKYSKDGRIHSERESFDIEKRLKDYLDLSDIEYTEIVNNQDTIQTKETINHITELINNQVKEK